MPPFAGRSIVVAGLNAQLEICSNVHLLYKYKLLYSETKQRDRRSQPDPLQRGFVIQSRQPGHSLVLHDAVGQTGLASSKSGLELVEPERA